MYPVAPDQESTVANSKAEADGKPPHTTESFQEKEDIAQQDATEQDGTRFSAGESTASFGEECYEFEEMYMPNLGRSGCVAISLTFFTSPSLWAVFILLLTCVGLLPLSLW